MTLITVQEPRSCDMGKISVIDVSAPSLLISTSMNSTSKPVLDRNSFKNILHFIFSLFQASVTMLSHTLNIPKSQLR